MASAVLDTLGLYAKYIGVSIRGQMQYRASFITQAIATMIFSLMEFVTIAALFDRFGAIQGWRLPEIAMFYGMSSMGWAIAQAIGWGFDFFASMVRTGEFDRILLRPRSAMLQILGHGVRIIRVGRFTQGLAVLIWAVTALDIVWTPAKAALLVGSILGGACLFIGLLIIQATICFWTTESLEIMNCMTDGGKEAAQFPMTIYRPWFRRFFTYVVPVACMNYLPGTVILGRVDPSGLPAILHWLSPAAGPAFMLASLLFWRLGVRHYHSTGS